MSLQRKFAVLIGLLGLTVAVSLGTAWWSFDLLQREVAAPFSRIAEALNSLGRLNALLGGQSDILAEARDDATKAAFLAHSDRIRDELRALEEQEAPQRSTGASTARNLRARVESAISAGKKALESGDPAAAEQARAETEQAREVIQRIERRMLAEAGLATSYSTRLRARLALALTFALASALLAGALALLLVRRWVIRPVADLRAAAARIAAGDFSHRLDIHGRDEVAQLGSEVNHMAAMVSAMQEERVQRERLAAVGEMVRRLVHNLRNPLAGIRGLAELTREELPADSDLRESQDRIVATVDRFEHWLADLLNSTSPLAIEPEQRPVRAWLEGVVAAHRPMAQSRGVRLEIASETAPERAFFDARHLEQAVVAILTNAIEASPQGGLVRIGVAAAEGGEWVIRVEDQGPGVPHDLRERVFSAQFTTKPTGTGIGLAVAQQVVRGHGGRITIEPGLPALGARDHSSNNGHGAAFVVTLPAAAAGSGRAGRLEGDTSGPDPGR